MLLKCDAMKFPYPAPPDLVPEDVTQPSPAFQQEVRKVILAILLFVVVYLIMVILALALTMACISLGLGLIALRPSIWTLLIGAGMMFMGVMVMFFLVKFVFSRAGSGDPEGIVLEESEEPELFAFIRRVTAEVGTHFPKKILLIPDVNASVFYSSSFWSLFFPIRKNLNIGLGLVNCLNVSEFKAVLAHEFGHFSQRSMRLGSYTYFVNQAIYNMLYRNSGWAGALETIAGIHAVLTFFAQVAVWIVQGIQWVLRQMYGIINRQYLSLSRQMEFHADAVAASVAGSNNMIQALRQVTMGSQTYQETIDQCNELLRRNVILRNFYQGQQVVAQQFAQNHNLQLQHGLPMVNQSFTEHQRKARVVFHNQWASHPTDAEREESLLQLNVDARVVDVPAWALFRNAGRWQAELTNFLYREVEKSPERNLLDPESFRDQYLAAEGERQLPKVFNGYYDERFLAEADLDLLTKETGARDFDRADFEALFQENLSRTMAFVQTDIQVLEAIAAGQIDTKTFDFDGQKYRSEEAGTIRTQLEAELVRLQAELDRRDAESVRFFYGIALWRDAASGERLLDAYRRLYAIARLKKRFDLPGQAVFLLFHFLAENDFFIAPGDLSLAFAQFRNSHEPTLRELFGEMAGAEWASAELRAQLDEYCSKERNWMHENQAHSKNLEYLAEVIQAAGRALDKEYAKRLKAMVDYQASLLPEG